MTPNIGEDFVGWRPPTGGDRTLGLVDFAMFPHLDHADLPDNTMANAERWAAGMPVPAYAIDDQTAIKVVDGTVESSPRGSGNCLRPRLPECSASAPACDRAGARAPADARREGRMRRAARS